MATCSRVESNGVDVRILVFSNAYKPTVSGVVTSIRLFRQGLTEAGHDVHIIVPEYEEYQDKEPYVFRFPALDISEQADISLVIPFKRTMSPTVHGIQPDLIHSQHPIWMGNLAIAFARDLNLPLVFTFHTRYDMYAPRYVPIAPKLTGVVAEEIVRAYLEKCAHIVAPTPSIRDFILRQYAPEAPVTTVPTPVDLGQYDSLNPWRVRADLGLENVELLLYVGRLADEKNLYFLLRAFAKIIAARPQARLLLVGQGSHKHSLQRLAQKLGIGEQVIFIGSIPHDEIPHYAAAADLFVFASMTDTQGLVLIEAMAAGTPVVAVQAPGPTDMLAEGGGVLVPASEGAFANAVLALLADEARRRAMGEQAARAVQRYTISATAARMSAVYEEAVAAGPRTIEKESILTRGLKLELRLAEEVWRGMVKHIRLLGESSSTRLVDLLQNKVFDVDNDD